MEAERVAIYPGSFNPWHEGHEDILIKSLKLFDRIVVARGVNPTKGYGPSGLTEGDIIFEKLRNKLIKDYGESKITAVTFSTLLPELVTKWKAVAVIRGLRNGHDLQYEMNQQYWYEDLGLKVPVIYLVCGRQLSHISSSAIRSLKEFQE